MQARLRTRCSLRQSVRSPSLRTEDEVIQSPPSHQRTIQYATLRLTCEPRTGPPAALEYAAITELRIRRTYTFSIFQPGQLNSDDAGQRAFRHLRHEANPLAESEMHWQPTIANSSNRPSSFLLGQRLQSYDSYILQRPLRTTL
jgi:hypothetical protein